MELSKNQYFRRMGYLTIIGLARPGLAKTNCTWMHHRRWINLVVHSKAASSPQDLLFRHNRPAWAVSPLFLGSYSLWFFLIASALVKPSSSEFLPKLGKEYDCIGLPYGYKEASDASYFYVDSSNYEPHISLSHMVPDRQHDFFAEWVLWMLCFSFWNLT